MNRPPPLHPSPQGGGGARRTVRAFLGIAVACVLAACTAEQGPHASIILADDAAPKLSDYGFFATPNAGAAVSEGVRPYDLVNALFSDHAAKHRYVYVPKGQSAKYDPNNVFDFPVGSVLIKTFAFAPDMRDPALNERWIETRLLIHKQEGWVAYPYIWNAGQTEAIYAPVGGKQTIETITPDGQPITINYAIPNRNQCKECHQTGKELIPIGPKARNLNHVGPAGVNQIADWTERSILTGAPADLPTVPAAFGDGALEDRARAWLDINCAHCHKADGGASNSGLFLDWHETDPTGWGVHKRPTAAGRGSGDNMFVIEPGHPEQSILLYRMDSTEPGVVMPELGRTVIDPHSIELIREWIAAMPKQTQ
ncbi:MAG: SO2930 family diheme c-type cytochrome [Hyphomonadaceae bacterium]|nr:SO2930 family diheme c-type cytochrome [Hyphomonadaceae bacterium]